MSPEKHLMSHQPGNQPPQYLDRNDVIDIFKGQWVLMRVTKFDAAGWPLHGEVLAHSRSRKQISETLAKLPPQTETAPSNPYYVFRASPRTRTGPGFADAMQELTAQIRQAQEERRGRKSR
jgi:hypothetical protein